MARRPSRSVAKAGVVDFTDLLEFQHKLAVTAALADDMAADYESDWGEQWAEQIRQRVPRGANHPQHPNIHLKTEIRQIEPGGITMGRAFWWRFLEYGTKNGIAPRGYVNKAMKKIRTPARKDAAARAVELIQSGKVRGRAS